MIFQYDGLHFFFLENDVKLLVEWGANVNKINEDFLIREIKRHNLDFMDLLMQKGLRYNGLNEDVKKYIKEYRSRCMHYTRLNSKLPDELLKIIEVYI